MPKCRNCNAPIFFLSEKPKRIVLDGFTDRAREEITEPKNLPIDVDPSPEGTLAIFEDPNPHSVYPPHGRDFKGVRKKYIARLSGYALESYKRLGGVVYRLHFDSCRNPRRN